MSASRAAVALVIACILSSLTACMQEHGPSTVDSVIDAEVAYTPSAVDQSAMSMQETVTDSDAVEVDAGKPSAVIEDQLAVSMYATDFSDTLLLGDSIMVLTADACRELMPEVTVNAVGARSIERGGAAEEFTDDTGVLDWLRSGVADGFDRVVIGTGSNDPPGLTGEQLDEMLMCLDGKDVWLVTELVADNAAGSDATNTVIDTAVSDSRARKIDWAAVASSDVSLYLADNCHPSWPDGVETYAKLVHDALAGSMERDANVTDTEVSQTVSDADAANSLLPQPSGSDAIMGRTLTTVDAMVSDFESHGGVYPSVYALKGAATFRDWATQCYEESIAEGVRAEVVYAQSMHETGWLSYGGQVSEEQCNFAGIGAVNSGGAGASFSSVREGVRAQVQHLKAYASTDQLENECVDPRFDLVERGVATTLTGLNGRWAVPGTTYGQTLQSTVDRIVS